MDPLDPNIFNPFDDFVFFFKTVDAAYASTSFQNVRNVVISEYLS